MVDRCHGAFVVLAVIGGAYFAADVCAVPLLDGVEPLGVCRVGGDSPQSTPSISACTQSRNFSIPLWPGWPPKAPRRDQSNGVFVSLMFRYCRY